MNSNPEQVYASAAYRRSRNAYRLECTFEYFVSLLVADAFLAKLLSSLGMSDGLIGIISSFITLAFLFQLFSVFVVDRITNTKRFVILFHSLSQFFFMSLYLIPFLPFAKEYRHALVVVCVLLAYFGNYFVTSVIFKWGNSFVDPHKRGAFSAGKEMISLASGIVMTLILGHTMDAFEAADNLTGGFIFAAIAILIFSTCDFICLMLIKNDIKAPAEKRERLPLREVMKNTLGNRNFRSVIYLTILWDVARYISVGFLGTYRVGELAFAVGTVQIINMIGNAGRFALSRPFGKFSDKYSYARGIELALLLAAIGFGFMIFTSPTSRWLVVGYTLFFSMSMAGLNQNLMNITYSYVDSKYFVQASALKNSIGGLFGFGASLLGSRILTSIQANGNTVFGLPLYGQQLLSAISVILLVVALLFTHFVIAKQKRMVQ